MPTEWIRVASVYLAVQLAIFAIVKFAFRVGWSDLVGPYFAFAASFSITFFMAWFANNRWVNGKATPRQYAFSASLMVAFLALSADGAFAYLGLALHLPIQGFLEDWTNWAFVVLPLTLFVSIGIYRSVYLKTKAYRDSLN